MTVPSKDEVYSKRGYSLLETIDNLGARSVLWRLRATVSFYGAVYGAAALFGVWFLTTDSVHLSTDKDPIDYRVKTKLSNQAVLLVNRWTGQETMKEIHKPEGACPSSDTYKTLWVSKLIYSYYKYLSVTEVSVRLNVSNELLPYRFAVSNQDLSRLGHRHATSVRTVDQNGEVHYQIKGKQTEDDPYEGVARGNLPTRMYKRTAVEDRPAPLEILCRCHIQPMVEKSHVLGSRSMVEQTFQTAMKEEIEQRYHEWIVRAKGGDRAPVLTAEMLRYGSINGEGVRAVDIVGEEGSELFQQFSQAVVDRATKKIGRKMVLRDSSFTMIH